MSVVHMHCIVEIDAGEDGEHIGLQQRDTDFQAGQRNGEGKRQDAADDADAGKRDAPASTESP